MPYPKKPVLDLGPKNPMLLALEKARKDRLSKTPALTNTKPGAMRRDVAGVSSSAGGSGGGGGGGGGGGMTSWQIKGDSGTTETVINTDLVTIAGGTGLSSVGSSPDTVTLNLDNTAVTPGSYTYASLTVDAQGRLTAASSGTAPMVDFTLAGSSGTQTIANGNTLTVAAGTGVLSTPVTATDTVTINTAWSKSSAILSPTTANDQVLVSISTGAAPAINGINSSTTSGSVGVQGDATGASGAVIGVLGATSSSDNAAYGGKFNRTDLGDWADVDEQGSDPATPPSGKGRYFGKTDGKAYYKNDAGTEYDLTATGGAAALSIHSVADADYTPSTSDNVILYTSLTATRTVSLPAASSYGSGAVVIVKDGSGSAAFATNITIDPNSTETIDGAGTKKITSAYGSLTLLTNGSNWFII